MAEAANPPPATVGELSAIIVEDWRRHGRDWTLPGFRAVAVYRFGTYVRTVRGRRIWDKVRRRILRVAYRSASRFIRNVYGIELRDTARIGRRLKIAHQGGIVIHYRARIGDDCQVLQGVTIGIGARGIAEEPPVIGDRVSFGAGSIVVGPVTIGDDVKVGPGALVMRDVPAGATVFAEPSRIMRLSREAAAGA